MSCTSGIIPLPSRCGSLGLEHVGTCGLFLIERSHQLDQKPSSNISLAGLMVCCQQLSCCMMFSKNSVYFIIFMLSSYLFRTISKAITNIIKYIRCVVLVKFAEYFIGVERTRSQVKILLG